MHCHQAASDLAAIVNAVSSLLLWEYQTGLHRHSSQY
jgi:hypothetical protein